MKNKNILIVGGAGYIGGYMVDLLKSKDYNITVFDSLVYENQYLKEVDFIFGDIRDTNYLKRIAKDFDIVVWLAALVGDGACAVDVELTTEINYSCFRRFIEVYSGKIIFTSTCSVYGLNDNLIDESAKPNPLSVYAETKLLAENYLIDNHDNYLIFRLGTLYGVSDLFSRIRLDLVLNVLSQKAACGETLSVFGGEQWRPLLHVKDVTHATVFGIENDIQGLYNLSAQNYTIKQLAEEIEKIIPETKINYSDMKFEDLRNYKVKNDKLLSTGYNQFIDIKEGIKEIVDIFKQKRVFNPAEPLFSNVAFLEKNITTRL